VQLSRLRSDMGTKSVDAIIIGGGFLLGIWDSLLRQNNLTYPEYFLNGAPLALPASMVSYGVYLNMSESIGRVAAPIYVSHLGGQTVGELIKTFY